MSTLRGFKSDRINFFLKSSTSGCYNDDISVYSMKNFPPFMANVLWLLKHKSFTNFDDSNQFISYE